MSNGELVVLGRPAVGTNSVITPSIITPWILVWTHRASAALPVSTFTGKHATTFVAYIWAGAHGGCPNPFAHKFSPRGTAFSMFAIFNASGIDLMATPVLNLFSTTHLWV